MGNLTHTVSGDIASFRSAARVPIESLKCHFKPKQDLHGYSKPWPAGGGKNLFNINSPIEYGAYNPSNGDYGDSSIRIITDYIPINYNVTYTMKINSDIDHLAFINYNLFDENKVWLCARDGNSDNNFTGSTEHTFTINISNAKYIRIVFRDLSDSGVIISSRTLQNCQLQLEVGSTATSYEPYENICPIEGWNNIIVHKVKKNLFNFDINNVEYDIPNDKGELRSIYHTGIISDGKKISASATLIDTELTGNATINLGYLQNETLYQITALTVWDTGVGYSKTVSIPIGQELLLVNAANSAYGWTRNIPRYNIQIEINDINTIFEPYCDEQIPITFPVLGKNKFNINSLVADGIEVVNGVATGTGTAFNRAWQASQTKWINFNAVQGQPVTLSLKAYTDGNQAQTETTGLVIYMYFTDDSKKVLYIPNTTLTPTYYTLTSTAGKDVLHIAISYGSNGNNIWHLSEFQIEYNDTATSYEPYNPDNTVYGGYVDIIKGEVVAEYELLTTTWGECTYRTSNDTVDIKIAKFKNPIYGSSEWSFYKLKWCNICQHSFTDTNNKTPHFYTGYSSGRQQYEANIFLPLNYDNNQVIQILGTLINPIHYPISKTELKTFLDRNNIWSNTNDITEATYTFTDYLMSKRVNMNNAYMHGKLKLWLNADDAPINNYWIDRINGMAFELVRGATYDSANKLYDCSGQGILRKGNINDGTVNFGHHFRIEFDVEYNRVKSTNGMILDIGSLAEASRALGVGFPPNTGTQLSFNWKMEGNNSNPFTVSGEIRDHINLPSNTDEFIHYYGYFDLQNSGKGYDILRIKINDKIAKYDTQIPPQFYKEDWQSTRLFFTIGGGVYNASSTTYDPNSTSYACFIKIREIKVYVYD